MALFLEFNLRAPSSRRDRISRVDSASPVVTDQTTLARDRVSNADGGGVCRGASVNDDSADILGRLEPRWCVGGDDDRLCLRALGGLVLSAD
jgi:hypothetical protein